MISIPFSSQLVRPFLSGLVAVLPFAITMAIIVWVTNFVRGMLGPETLVGRMLKGIGFTAAPNLLNSYAIGILLTMVAIYLLGLLLEAGLKRRWTEFSTRVIERVPLIGTVYSAASRILGMLVEKNKTDLSAMSTVWCLFGGEGGTAVLGLMPTAERITIHGHDYHAVLVPSAPVPFGGGLLYVPVDWVKPAGFAVDKLLEIYVSMGMTPPPHIVEIIQKNN